MKPLPTKTDVYILDPRLLPANFAAGFVTGMQYQTFIRSTQHSRQIEDGGYVAELTTPSLLSANHRTVLYSVESDRLAEERHEVYRLLSRAGVRGFAENGTRSGHSHEETIRVPVGTFEQPIARRDESYVLEAIETSLQVNFGGHVISIALGDLEIPPIQSVR